MRSSTVLVAFSVIGMMVSSAPAICPSGMSPEVFCDDYDCYCSGAPCQQTPPTKCAIGALKDTTLMMQAWPVTSQNEATGHECGQTFNVEDSFMAFSPPFGCRYPCQSNVVLAQRTVGLISRIGAAYGSQYDSMTGTDLHPLVLTFNVHGQTGGKILAANFYMELAYSDDRAPTNYVNSPDCTTFCSPSVNQAPLPIICAQNVSVPGCPDVSTAPTHASIAVGFLAYLDPDPCHCLGSQHGSKSQHLAYFDGKRWWTLRAGVFPGSGDFALYDERAVIKLTIMSHTVQIELTSQYPEPDVYSIATAPREYEGRFDRLRAGYGASCELNSSSWSCAVAPCRCIKGAPTAGSVINDDLVLYGGAGFTDPGTCCFSGTACTEVIEADCQSLGGTWNGPNTTCASRVCCPNPFADMDKDGDVDMNDFAVLQRCLTTDTNVPVTIESGCGCLDWDSSGTIDQVDLDKFISCAGPAGVPADRACDD